MSKEEEKLKEEVKELKAGLIIRDSTYFIHTEKKQYEDKLPIIESGPFVVDDSAFCPMSEAIKQLSRVNDPTLGQLSECYDFPNGKDTGKQLPITRQRNFGDLAEYSQEIRESAKNMNNEILRGQLEAAEKESFKKELESVKVQSSGQTNKE